LERPEAESLYFYLCGNIQALIDHWRNWLDFCAKLLLYLIQIEAVLKSDKVYSKAQVPKATGTPNPMKIRFRVFGKIEVDHNVNSLNIDPSRK